MRDSESVEVRGPHSTTTVTVINRPPAVPRIALWREHLPILNEPAPRHMRMWFTPEDWELVDRTVRRLLVQTGVLTIT